MPSLNALDVQIEAMESTYQEERRQWHSELNRTETETTSIKHSLETTLRQRVSSQRTQFLCLSLDLLHFLQRQETDLQASQTKIMDLEAKLRAKDKAISQLRESSETNDEVSVSYMQRVLCKLTVDPTPGSSGRDCCSQPPCPAR